LANEGSDPGAVRRSWWLWAGIGFAGVLLAAVLAYFLLRPAAVEEPSSKGQPAVAAGAPPVPPSTWGPEMLATLDQARSDYGGALAERVCVSCHGVDGASSTADRPSLAGQSAAAIYKQLLDFRTGARHDPFMTPVAQSLVATDLANLALFYGRHAHPDGELGRRAQPFNFGVQRLVAEGDSTRGIAACNGCHVNGGNGPVETPVLIGQQRQYLANQLRAYRDGRRRNDIDQRMRNIAGQLTDAEIEGLAAYYQGVE